MQGVILDSDGCPNFLKYQLCITQVAMTPVSRRIYTSPMRSFEIVGKVYSFYYLRSHPGSRWLMGRVFVLICVCLSKIELRTNLIY